MAYNIDEIRLDLAILGCDSGLLAELSTKTEEQHAFIEGAINQSDPAVVAARGWMETSGKDLKSARQILEADNLAC